MPAILIKIEDANVQRYIQKFPFLNNIKDQRRNEDILKQVANSICTRECKQKEEIPLDYISDCNYTPPEEDFKLYEEALGTLKLTRKIMEHYIDDYYWKTVQTGLFKAKNILSVGCGDGIELIFLRIHSPNARIVAIDWDNKVGTLLLDKLNVEYYCGDVNVILEKLGNDFDIIFSNHFLEHMHNPDQILKKFFTKLKSNAALVSVLPMDGIDDNVFSRECKNILEDPESLHMLDLGYFDLGHPWKTNPYDLYSSLRLAGFHDVSFLNRPGHLTRKLSFNKSRLVRFRKLNKTLYNLTFGFLYKAMKLIFPVNIPVYLVKFLYAIDSRVWFGSIPLKNAQAPEVLFIARRRG